MANAEKKTCVAKRRKRLRSVLLSEDFGNNRPMAVVVVMDCEREIRGRSFEFCACAERHNRR